MATRKSKDNLRVRTQVLPVISCSDTEQLTQIMDVCATPRKLTYQKLGSLAGWGLDWKRADKIVRTVQTPANIGLPAKIWEWSVNDTMKAISAQQEAASVALTRAIWRKYPLTGVEKERFAWLKEVRGDQENNSQAQRNKALKLFPQTNTEITRNRLLELLKDNPTGDNWLHRQFRKQYIKGRTYVDNQVVYQGEGYSAKRLTRNTIELKIQGLERGKRIALTLKARHVPNGQIRVIRNEFGKFEVHTIREWKVPKKAKQPKQTVGLDKGYTEGYYSSEGKAIAPELGTLMTVKSDKQRNQNRNRYRLWQHRECLLSSNPKKAARMLANNLGYRKKSRFNKRMKDTIKTMVRGDLRKNIAPQTRIVCEDLSSPIKSKKQSKRINNRLNAWMKGELQASVERIAEDTGSTVSVVNPAYTSQVDYQTGTLLGVRDGDRFIRYTGEVIQADYNAAMNIRHRFDDTDITQYLPYREVRDVLIRRTVLFLFSIGSSVSEAIAKGWLHPKFSKEALKIEDSETAYGV